MPSTSGSNELISNLGISATSEWQVDLIPLIINPSTVLDLCWDNNNLRNSYLSSSGEHIRLNLNQAKDRSASAYLTNGFPFKDKSIGFICAYDILEHLESRYLQFIVNEIVRVSNQACITYSSVKQVNYMKAGPLVKLPKGMTEHYLPNGHVVLAYNLPLIAVVGDNKKRIGGADQVIENIKLAIRELGFSAYEMYLTVLGWKLLREKSVVLWPLQILRTLRHNVSNFDAIITVHPSSHDLKHAKHLVYFQHHVRVYYDLYPAYIHRFSGIAKLGLWFVSRIVRYLDRRYLVPNLRKSRIITNSQNVANRLTKYNKLSADKIIYPGGHIDNVLTQSASNPKPIALSFSVIDVVRKGIELIIDAAKRFDDVEFIIAGAYNGGIRIDEDKLPRNVRLIARQISEEEKCRLFSNCNVFLAPYVDEDFGITPIEANSFGKPVVFCLDSGGLLETQKHLVTGYMTERDPQSFVEGIRYCILHAEEMKEPCVQNAKRFTWEDFRRQIAQEIMKLFE